MNTFGVEGLIKLTHATWYCIYQLCVALKQKYYGTKLYNLNAANIEQAKMYHFLFVY